MTCTLCGKELADDEIYACEQCADDCQHLEVVDKIRGESDCGESTKAKMSDMPGMVSP